MRPRDSAKRILGLEDVQSQVMETAFAEVETCVAHTDDDSLIESDEKAATFANWIALHARRNALNVVSLKDHDYKRDVERLAHHLRQHHAFFLTTAGNAFITCDNPITKPPYKDAGKDKELFFAPLGPRRSVIIVPDDKVPIKVRWNELTFKNAANICVSWDSDLHLSVQLPA